MRSGCCCAGAAVTALQVLLLTVGRPPAMEVASGGPQVRLAREVVPRGGKEDGGGAAAVPDALTAGFTAHGGSALQQSNACVVAVLWVVTAGIIAGTVWAAREVHALYGATLANLGEFEARLASTNRAEVGEFVAKYHTFLSSGGLNPTTACDVPFFANESSSGLAPLVDAYEFLDRMSLVFLVAGSCAAGILVLTKLIMSLKLVFRLNDEVNDPRILADEMSPRALSSGLQLVSGVHESESQRRTRLALRGEVFAYMFVNALLDLPVLTLLVAYYIMARNVRGTNCAICFDKRQMCTVNEFEALGPAFNAMLAIVSISLVWNVALLTERYLQYTKYAKAVRGIKNDHGVTMLYTSLMLLVYVFAIACPTLLLVGYWFGAPFLGLAAGTITGLNLTGWAGVALYGLAALAILSTVGIDPGEACALPFIGCELCELCFAVPCIGAFCDMPCC